MAIESPLRTTSRLMLVIGGLTLVMTFAFVVVALVQQARDRDLREDLIDSITTVAEPSTTASPTATTTQPTPPPGVTTTTQRSTTTTANLPEITIVVRTTVPPVFRIDVNGDQRADFAQISGTVMEVPRDPPRNWVPAVIAAIGAIVVALLSLLSARASRQSADELEALRKRLDDVEGVVDT